MTSVAPPAQDQDFQGASPSATDKVPAATLDSQFQATKAKITEILTALAVSIRDDNTLTDELVRIRNLHPELAALIASKAGWQPKTAVAVASTANLTLSGEQTIDGVLTAASRVLVKNQTLPAQNGIYVSGAGAWSRASDADTSTELGYAFVYVTGGTSQSQTTWVLTQAAADITALGTTALSWAQVGGVVGPIQVNKGGTGATTAPVARTNLGLGDWSTLNLINGIQVVDTIAQMKAAAPPTSEQTYLVRGYYAAGDGGGGTFRWNGSDSTSDNGGTIISLNAGGTGRWNRIYDRGEINVRWFGAKGDGVNDDYSAIQSALNRASLDYGAGVIFPGKGTYLISAGLIISPPVVTATSAVGSDVHFMSDMTKLKLFSNSQACIKATAAMTNMITHSVVALGGGGTYANFYTDIEGLQLDGNSLATNGIAIFEAMHTKIEKCNISGCANCITNSGYGVLDIVYNVLRGSLTCLDFTGGGDTLIMHNDFYVTNNTNGVILRPFAGNTSVFRNVFTPTNTAVADAQCTGIFLKADNAGDNVKTLGELYIHNNSFDGMKYGVKTKGFNASTYNVINVSIYENLCGAAGSVVAGTLAYLENSLSCIIHNNRVANSASDTALTALAYLLNCRNCVIHSNHVNRCTDDAITLDGSRDCHIRDNTLENFGLSGGTKCGIRLTGAGTFNTLIKNNRFNQSVGGSVGILAVVEQSSADYNIADYNQMYGLITTEYVRSGGNSRLLSRLLTAAAPTANTWVNGAFAENVLPTVGQPKGWRCTLSGTPGTWVSEGNL
jgi:parallel beta-helix repeat protein